MQEDIIIKTINQYIIRIDHKANTTSIQWWSPMGDISFHGSYYPAKEFNTFTIKKALPNITLEDIEKFLLLR